MLFDVFGSAKSRPKIAMISDFGRQIDSGWLVLEGSAAEAACRGRERVGVLKIEEHSLSGSARRTEGGGGFKGY